MNNVVLPLLAAAMAFAGDVPAARADQLTVDRTVQSGFVRLVGDAPVSENGAQSPCTRREPDSGAVRSVPCNERLAGDWSGMLTQSTGEKYRVEISLATDGAGTITYPKIPCSGTLAYEMRRGDAYVLRETITEGEQCAVSGEIVLTAVSADGSTFDFEWTASDTDVTVAGRLVGVMTAGATRTSGTTSKPGADNVDECMKYLPNRGSYVDMPCDAGVAATN